MIFFDLQHGVVLKYVENQQTNNKYFVCKYYYNPNYPLLGVVESHHKQHEEYKNLHGLVLSHNLAFSDACWPCEIGISAPLNVTLVPEVVFIQWKKKSFRNHSEIISLLHHVNMRILCCKCKIST